MIDLSAIWGAQICEIRKHHLESAERKRVSENIKEQQKEVATRKKK